MKFLFLKLSKLFTIKAESIVESDSNLNLNGQEDGTVVFSGWQSFCPMP